MAEEEMEGADTVGVDSKFMLVSFGYTPRITAPGEHPIV
jgi:hypothetical protein